MNDIPKTFGEVLREMQELPEDEIREWAEKQMRSGGERGRSADYLRIKAARAIKQDREANARLEGKSFRPFG